MEIHISSVPRAYLGSNLLVGSSRLELIKAGLAQSALGWHSRARCARRALLPGHDAPTSIQGMLQAALLAGAAATPVGHGQLGRRRLGPAGCTASACTSSQTDASDVACCTIWVRFLLPEAAMAITAGSRARRHSGTRARAAAQVWGAAAAPEVPRRGTPGAAAAPRVADGRPSCRRPAPELPPPGTRGAAAAPEVPAPY